MTYPAEKPDDGITAMRVWNATVAPGGTWVHDVDHPCATTPSAARSIADEPTPNRSVARVPLGTGSPYGEPADPVGGADES